MASVLSLWAGNTALTKLLSGTLYLAAHSSDPTLTGILATEVAGGGYARQRITFATPSGKSTLSTNAQTFPGMPAVTVTHLAVWTAISAGNLVYTIALTDPIDVLASAALLVTPGDVAITL